MECVLETDALVIYVGADQALLVLSNSQTCPRCGRTTLLLRYKNGGVACLGCNGPELEDRKNQLISGGVAAM